MAIDYDQIARGLMRLLAGFFLVFVGLAIILTLLPGCHFHVHVAERVVYERSWPAEPDHHGDPEAQREADDVQTPEEIIQELIDGNLETDREAAGVP